MSKKPSGAPLLEDGHTLDRDAIKAMFMISKFMDWTRFAEEQGWDSLFMRRQLPVRSWLKEKRDILTEKQLDILSGIIHERKFTWTHEIIKTLDTYPEAIDLALSIAKAKMQQVGDMYKDYLENFRGKPDKMYYKNRRTYHAFEKLSMTEISMLMKGMKDITDAKLKALMLDKWAITKLDMPLDDLPADIDEKGETSNGPRFTIEGKETLDVMELQGWFDRYFDKPPQLPEQAKVVSPQEASSNTIEKSEANGEA